jgi:hypothetical protein
MIPKNHHTQQLQKGSICVFHPGNQDKNKVNKAFKDKNKLDKKITSPLEFECVDVSTPSRKEGYRSYVSQHFLCNKRWHH